MKDASGAADSSLRMTADSTAGVSRYYVIALVLVTLLAYFPVLGNDFVAYDDPYYLLENPLVNRGVTPEAIRDAFTTMAQGHWHPLTWVSHQIDFALFGVNPAGHHAMNLLFHVLNVLLLFRLLRRLNLAPQLAAITAGLFALHPLHVESVAWASERKDVLCTFFMLLALIGYERYAREPRRGSYLGTLAFFAASLLAKSMSVTLPVLLLLLDWWPLRRLDRQRLARVLAEKVPFFLLSGVASVMAFLAQKTSGATAMGVDPGVAMNLANAVRSVALYLVKTVWPAGLAPLYLFPAEIPAGQIVGAILVLLGLLALAVIQRNRNPWITFGILWYLVTLLPIIGIVHVGFQALADRYTYIPHIGVFLAVVAAAEKWIGSRRGAATVVVSAVLLGLAAATYAQARLWRNSETLFRAAIARTSGNYVMMHNLGDELLRQGRIAEGVKQHELAAALRPDDPECQFSYGSALLQSGEFSGAEAHLRQALALGPSRKTTGRIYNNLGSALWNMGRKQEALATFYQALQFAPKSRTVRKNIEDLKREM
ncbi:tetratricopeptide repeat protein [Geomesophilobacter sediminis]|uniref:Tetratricopeptide repeat protein n=1 Tax=Geomesophilobacter sediminis TaxID=2798584 RepID=A0A8J7LYY1_9BACT|nr:tetratricopeptide repeat protein [Geomesophilobacter sediminis]MBJ6725707.1 tetratricopeptide repeat protein [Geomesophilobacter sediminis]